MPRVIAFDVNETLLDLGSLDPVFERAFGNADVRREWFGQMLQLAFVGGLTDDYVGFPAAQRAALAMLADAYGIALEDDVAGALANRMVRLDPHPDAADALTRLSDAGFTVAALTNSPLDAARAQLEHAGLADRFAAILSADDVRALKPRPEAYRHAADTFGVSLAEVRLVAAHAWDVSGALAAGCAAAFVTRPGKVASPLGAQPDIVGADLGEVADRIIASDGPR